MDGDLTLREHRQGDEIFQHDEGAWNTTAIREGINAELDTFSPMDMPWIELSSTTVSSISERASNEPGNLHFLRGTTLESSS